MTDRCETCAHFTTDDRRAPFGACARWLTGYSVKLEDMKMNEVLVEDDEGWGMIMGPEFGCVLHEPAPNHPAI